jgi:hypothetical protein
MCNTAAVVAEAPPVLGAAEDEEAVVVTASYGTGWASPGPLPLLSRPLPLWSQVPELWRQSQARLFAHDTCTHQAPPFGSPPFGMGLLMQWKGWSGPTLPPGPTGPQIRAYGSTNCP